MGRCWNVSFAFDYSVPQCDTCLLETKKPSRGYYTTLHPVALLLVCEYECMVIAPDEQVAPCMVQCMNMCVNADLCG